VATKADIIRVEKRVGEIEAQLEKTATKSDVRKLRKEIREGYLRVAKLATATPTRREFDELSARVGFHFPIN
jgi:hypothetical protein